MTDQPTPRWTPTARTYDEVIAALVERATGRPPNDTLEVLITLPPMSDTRAEWADKAARLLIPDADVLPDDLPDLIRTIAAGYGAPGSNNEIAGRRALRTLAKIFDVELDR